MKFGGICLITDDVKLLKQNYETIFNCTFEGDDNFAYIKFGENHISMYSKTATEALAPGSTKNIGYGGTTIEIGVSNIDEMYERISRLDVSIVKDISTTPWKIRSFWIKDIDGNIINFNMKVSA